MLPDLLPTGLALLGGALFGYWYSQRGKAPSAPTPAPTPIAPYPAPPTPASPKVVNQGPLPEADEWHTLRAKYENLLERARKEKKDSLVRAIEETLK